MTLLKAPRAAFLSGPRYESHSCNQYVVYLCSQVSSSLEYVQVSLFPRKHVTSSPGISCCVWRHFADKIMLRIAAIVMEIKQTQMQLSTSERWKSVDNYLSLPITQGTILSFILHGSSESLMGLIPSCSPCNPLVNTHSTGFSPFRVSLWQLLLPKYTAGNQV